MHLGMPQIIYLALIFFSLGISIVKHGESKKGNENFFTTLISIILLNGLLYWGGFYK